PSGTLLHHLAEGHLHVRAFEGFHTAEFQDVFAGGLLGDFGEVGAADDAQHAAIGVEYGNREQTMFGELLRDRFFVFVFGDENVVGAHNHADFFGALGGDEFAEGNDTEEMLGVVENVGVIDHLDVLGLAADFGDGVDDGELGGDADVAGVHQAGGFIFGIERASAVKATFGHHGDFQIAGLVEDLFGEVESAEPFARRVDGRTDEDMSDAVLMAVVDQRVSGFFVVDDGGVDMEIFGKTEMAFDGLALRSRQRGKFLFGTDEDGDAGGVQIVGNTPGAAEKHRSGGIGGDNDEDFFGAGFGGFFFGGGASLERLRGLANSQFAERDQRRLLEKALGLGFRTLGSVDRAAFEAVKQGAGGDVDENDLIGLLEDPVGDGLANAQAGDVEDLVGEAGEILYIHGGEDIDAGVEDDLDILPAARTFRTGRVGVREIVDDADFRRTLKDGRDVHFRGVASAAGDLQQRDLLELRGFLFVVGARLRFEERQHDIFAAI